MKNPPLRLVTKNPKKFYPINQSALYKIGSKKRLAKILATSLGKILLLSSSTANYKIFCLPEEVCQFTKKVQKARWVQEPKKELRVIHERVQKLLRSIAHPEYTHAVVKGRSYRTNAAAHKDSARVATFDLRKFYPSTSSSRVREFWVEQMSCAPDVADLLVKLTCHNGCLPTGSPLSPLLALYANKPMFEAFNNLAISHDLIFTCYVDDLTFSGDVVPIGLPKLVSNIAQRFGHSLSIEKTRLFGRNQHKHVTGVILYGNALHVPHTRFLKARAIREKLLLEKDAVSRLKLARKLSGLLGEAAYLDARYSKLAVKSYGELKKMNEEIDSLPF
ncbi:reverse transcriptase family protein [Oxalobacteraceae bacterium OTU3REALA1]|nr:reverse transcriptase family protein [Oxalobacteraceae bacterium OTU3REALA1]